MHSLLVEKGGSKVGAGQNKLSAAKVAKCTKPGYLLDGGNLYLQVTPRASVAEGTRQAPASVVSKSWCFRYRDRAMGKQRELGLGPFPDVSLEEARVKAGELRVLLLKGKDPMAERQAQRTAIKVEAAKVMTFDEAAANYIEGKKSGWKNEKHAAQWENTLTTYASPIIGSLPVASIDQALAMKVLTPIWNTKNETASRVRQRMEAVLGWATVSGYRQGENPARWKNYLSAVLPKPSDVQEVKHQPALPYAQLGAFMEVLREQDAIAPMALELTILTAMRTENILGATPGEFDLRRGTWTIPKERMKGKKEHIVPLTPRAVEIVQAMLKLNDPYLFPGGKKGKSLSEAAMLQVTKRMDAKSIESGGKGWRDEEGRTAVPHGFRSTFRDWAGEVSAYTREVIENALAHKLKDKAEAAYARGTQLAKRKALMESWAMFCDRPSEPMAGNVVPMRSAQT
jgi:integrase